MGAPCTTFGHWSGRAKARHVIMIKMLKGIKWHKMNYTPKIGKMFDFHASKFFSHSSKLLLGNFLTILKLPPTAWLHMTLHHASVSSLHCRASGTVGTRGIGEAGFLPKDLQTVSNIPMPKPAESQMASKWTLKTLGPYGSNSSVTEFG